MNTDRALLSVAEAGSVLGVSEATAYRMARAGQLPTIKLGGGGSMRVIRSRLVEQYGISNYDHEGP